jgi:hypothetical protein
MRDERISEILAFARSLGIGDAKVLGVDRITVEDRFRSYCAEPRCPNYNTSINCPPHSMTPDQFREHLKGFTLVLAFKFDMPMEAVQGTELREASLLLHETTAAIEHQAQSLGFERARGLRGASGRRRVPSPGQGAALTLRHGRQLVRVIKIPWMGDAEERRRGPEPQIRDRYDGWSGVS